MHRRTLMLGAPALLSSPAGAAPPEPRPAGAEGSFAVLADWTFGNRREGATVRNMDELRKSFYFRYIYNNGQLDGLPNYWSVHRDYPEGDPRSLHVFTADSLLLKGRVPPGGGMRPHGIESGILRAKLPVTPGTYIEMRAKLPHNLGVWPAFWINSGVEHSDGTFSELHWPPEIDIFEFFVWQNRTRPEIMTGYVQRGGNPAAYGPDGDVWTLFSRGEYRPGMDFSATWNVFALDWQQDAPVWVLNGKPLKQTRYKWPGPPGHILVTNQIGIALPGTDMTGMTDGGDAWDYAIDYLRVFRRT